MPGSCMSSSSEQSATSLEKPSMFWAALRYARMRKMLSPFNSRSCASSLNIFAICWFFMALSKEHLIIKFYHSLVPIKSYSLTLSSSGITI